jgi:hypothetical protein
MEKNMDPDLGFGSGMNILDHFSKSLETVFWVNNTFIFLSRSRSGMQDPELFGPWIRDRGWKNSDPVSRIWDP